MAKNPFPFGSIDYDNWNYEHPADAGSQADPIADAKLSLAKADALEMNRDIPDASTRASVQALMPQFDTLEKKYAGGPHGLLRGTTEGTADIAAPLALASFIPGIGQAAGLASMATAAPDFLRRTFAPEADESRPGAVESALTALPMALPAIKGLKALAAERSLAPIADILGGRARAFEGAAQPMRPWPRPSTNIPREVGVDSVETFNEIARRKAAGLAAQSPIEQLMESPSFRNLPKGNVSKAAPKSVAGYHAQDLLENPQSEAFAAREFAANKPIADNVFGRNVDLLGRPKQPLEVNLDIPKSEPISPLERLAARSQERFGRRFRKE